MRLELDTIAPSLPSLDFQSPVADILPERNVLLQRGISAAQAGDRQVARVLLNQAVENDPRSEDAWMWLASISEYPEELLAFLKNVLAINPENEKARRWQGSTQALMARTFVQRAVAANEEGDRPLAHRCLDQALAYNPECVLAWSWKASLTSDSEEKQQYLRRVLELDADNAEARSALVSITSGCIISDAKIAAKAGKRKKAFELVDEFLRVVPNNSEAWILRSHLCLNMADKVFSLEKALEIDPENVAARSAHEFLAATLSTPPTPESSAISETVVESLETVAPPAEPAIESVPLDQELAHYSATTAAETTAAAAPSSLELDSLHPYSETTVEYHEAAVNLSAVDAQPRPYNAEPQVELDGAWMVPTEYEQTGAFEIAGVAPIIENSPAAARPYQPLESDAADADVTFDLEVPALDSKAEPDLFPAAPELTCFFCRADLGSQVFECRNCLAILTLSDLERLLEERPADRGTIQNAVTQMEAEWHLREFGQDETRKLAIGHLNLRNYSSGLSYLQEAVRMDDNNVILSGQANALAIRLDEMRRQAEVHGAMTRGKTILVVDDSPTVRKLIAGKLEKSGHQVICAEDGVEALTYLKDDLPDLVLLDINMPRMDGYEVCKQIRANPAAESLPIVMISGRDGFFDKVRGRMAGTTGYVTKPFGPETLMKALETYLVPEAVEAA